MLLHGDCKEMMGLIVGENSIDALITDPPAGIAFMGKDWDKDRGGRDAWIEWMADVMRECYRVMKPGAHGFVWALPRTSHWTATACENAGFEIRDIVMHVFGTGFPKSHDVSKAIDRAKGAERALIKRTPYNYSPDKKGWKNSSDNNFKSDPTGITREGKRWEGWGTALKPAAEHWVLIRKPLIGTVAKNVLFHGTGAINIDASRVEFQCESDKAEAKPKGRVHRDRANHPGWDIEKQNLKDAPDPNSQGRFPSNFIASGEARNVLDEQSLVGGMHSAGKERRNQRDTSGKGKGMFSMHGAGGHRLGDSGGASRFFYCAKASKSERNAGCEGMEEKIRSDADGLKMSDPRMKEPQKRVGNTNHHPTVKAQKLMRYLCNMITPPGGTILDPFAGSGSTGVAAVTDGFEFIGIEQEQEYFDIAHARIERARRTA